MSNSPQVEALLRERRGYELYGNTDRVKQVDEQLAALGYTRATAKKSAPKERAAKKAPESRG